MPDDALDAARFDGLAALATAASDAGQRLRLADEALTLWRGRPNAGLADLPQVATEVTRLEAVRLDLRELRAQALARQ